MMISSAMIVALTIWMVILLAGLLILVAALNHPRVYRIVIPARIDRIRPFVVWLESTLANAGVDPHDQFQVHLAMDEALTNIILHSYHGDESAEIHAVVKLQSGHLEIDLIDTGEPYNPGYVTALRPARRFEDVRPGGLGLYLMKQVMDEVSYEPDPAGNCLTLVKRVSSSS